MNAEMDINLRIKESTIKQLEKAMCKIKHYETAHIVSGFLMPEMRRNENKNRLYRQYSAYILR